MRDWIGDQSWWVSVWMALMVGLWMGAMGCASTPDVELAPSYDFDEGLPGVQALGDWIAGQPPELEEPAGADELFARGEFDYWRGDLESAYHAYVAMLRDYPGHELNRYAAYRLVRMRHDIVNFVPRVIRDLEAISFDSESALTRIELSRLSHEVAQELWRRSDQAKPFDSAQRGLIHYWRATPMLSPWRLGDFETPMAPEVKGPLDDRYRSPLYAADVPANDESSDTVYMARSRDELSLGRSGIYYLESQVTVRGDQARDFTVYGRFPGAARVWIDGQEVLDRPEKGYESGQVARPIRLAPGDHRVLVKLGYESRARNWFELLFVPVSGQIWDDTELRAQPTFGGRQAGVEVLGGMRQASQLEPVRSEVEPVDHWSSPKLYMATLSAYASGDTEGFLGTWNALMERHPEFAAGHLLGSYQVRTRWDVPSQLRQSQSISMLRRAEALAPDNLHVLMQLARTLRDRGEDREYQRVLDRARELTRHSTGVAGAGSRTVPPSQEVDKGAHRGAEHGASPEAIMQLRPLVMWARHLERKGWSQQAEQAWQEVLEINPDHCIAIRRLYGLYRNRNHFPAPERLSNNWHACSRMVDRWVREHPQRYEQRREFRKRQASRYPYDPTRQRVYAEVLREGGDRDRAHQVLAEAVERMPDNDELWKARIELALSDSEFDQARRWLEEATRVGGRNSQFEWKKGRLDESFPLQDLMVDGHQAAMEEVARTGDDQAGLDEDSMGLDDAYYVVDFAGREYFEDGSSWTLTHQVIRVMTRGAIDRYAEMTVPSGAHLLEVRTIKQDGEVRMPEGVSGDATLSMPGLARGDMVEIAYLQFRGPRRVAHQINSGRFYFQMANVSSRHSEYVVIADEPVKFERANGPPDPEQFEYHGKPATRFVARDSRRPRSEPRRVGAQEYLPWVREVRIGMDKKPLEVARRDLKESLMEGVRPSPMVDRKIADWLEGEGASEDMAIDDDAVRRVYYGATDLVRQISARAFSTDAAHVVQHRRGSPIVVLHQALSQLGVEHDVYVARSDEQPPRELSLGEINRYRRALIRIVMPDTGQVRWVQTQRRDEMFGAVDPEIDGQLALCITCPEFERKRVEMQADKRPKRHIELVGELDEDGDLRGTLNYRFDGVRAARVRAALRGRSDKEQRRSYFEQVLTDQISGSHLKDVDILGEGQPEEPLRFEIAFERPGFGRVSDGELVVDRVLFREAMQRIYTQPATRETALFVGYQREQSYSLTIALPSGVQTRLRALDVDDAASKFGDFHRRTWIDDDVLRLESSIRLGRQRVTADDYDAFRQWTRTVEESAPLWLSAQLPDLVDGSL